MKSIFITGASSGIGKEAAILFAKHGWFVGITDIDRVGLDILQKDMDGKAGFSAIMNVTNADQVAAVLRDFSQACGGQLDAVLNNAGILRVNCCEKIPLVEQQAIIDVDVKGVLNCSYHAFPYLSKNPGSHLINMASVSGLVATPTLATYSASKFWVKAFTEALNIEWERYGIHVCDIIPNFVHTGMVESNSGEIINNVGVGITPKAVAETIWKAAHSKRIHWILDTPQNKLLFALHGIMPYPMVRSIIKHKAGL